MALTYAGIPLLYDFQGAAQSFLDRFQRIEDLLHEASNTALHNWQTAPVRTQGQNSKPVGLPKYNWPEPPQLRINQLYWPSGASRFSYGLFLISREHITALQNLNCTYGYALASESMTVPSGTIDGGGSTPHNLTFSEMYFLTPQRIGGCDTESDLFLLPLVDRRYWWQFLDTGDILGLLKQKNQYCETTCQATWDELLEHLAEIITETYTAGSASIPAAYGTPDCVEFIRQYANFPVFLDAVAASVGARVVSNLNGTIGFQRPATAYIALEKNLNGLPDQIAGTDCQHIEQSHLPQTVRVTFPKAYCYHLNCDGDKYIREFNEELVECEKIGYSKTIHSTAPALYDCACDYEDAEPSNTAQLQSLANQIGVDWKQWRRFRYDITYAAPQAWDPTGYDDHILWSFGGETWDCYEPATSYTTGRPGAEREPDVSLNDVYRRDHFTRVQSLPLGCDVDSMFHNLGVSLLPDTVLIKIDECWAPDECCQDSGQEAQWLATTGTVHRYCECDYVEDPSYQIPVYTALSHLCEMMPQLKARIAAGYSIPVLDNCCEFMWARWNCEEHRWHVEAKYDDLWRFELAAELCRGECGTAYLVLAPCRGTPVTTNIEFTVCDTIGLMCASSATAITKVIAQECILPGETGTAKVATWDSAQQKYVEGSEAVTVDNSDCLVIALPGDTILVDQPPASGGSGEGGTHCLPAGTRGVARFWPDTCQFEIMSLDNCSSSASDPGSSGTPLTTVLPTVPFGLTRRVLIQTEIACGETGYAILLSNAGSSSSSGEVCAWTYDEENPCEILVCNTSNRPIACDAPEYATVHLAPGECIGWLVPDARPLEATAELVNGSAGTSPAIGMCIATGLPTIEIEKLNVTDVCEWPFRTTPDRVKNPLGLLACVGDNLLLGWDAEDCEWYVKQVQPHVDIFITDLECFEGSEVCGINAKTKEIGYQTCCPIEEEEGEGSRPLEGLTMTNVDIPIGASFNCETCQFEIAYTQLCLLVCGAKSGGAWTIPGVVMDVPQSIEVGCYGETTFPISSDGLTIDSIDLIGGEMTFQVTAAPAPVEPNTSVYLDLTINCACGGGTTSVIVWQGDTHALDTPMTTELPACECNCWKITGQWHNAQDDSPIGAAFEMNTGDAICEETGDTCNIHMGTKKVCVLGCDLGTGTALQFPTSKVDVITEAQLVLDEEDGLCLEPFFTELCIIGCIGTQEEGIPSCVPIDPCPPEDSSS